MPGFVDVSNMSDLEIKRLGQMDDTDRPYRNPYAYRKPAKPIIQINYDIDKVFAASVLAHRANKGYIKAVAPGLNQSTNRQLVEQYLKDDIPFDEADLEEGRKIRQYIKGLTFKMIEGKTLSPFLKNALDVASRDVVTSTYALTVITSLPASYDKMVARDNVDRKINWAKGGYVGAVGDKVTVEIEIVKQLWSQNYNTWYLTGITDDDNVLFFSYKKQLEIGVRVKIEGTVKGTRDKSTQLNRVKVIENV